MKSECESKIKLLRVAMQLISESSYGSVSVDDICKRAEVKKGSFYYFFPSKSDLMVAAMEADWQARQPDLDGVFSTQIPPLDRIARFCEGACRGQLSRQTACGKVCGCPTITLGAELSTQDEKIRLKTHEIMGRYVKYLESAIRDAMAAEQIPSGHARALAEDVFAYFQGLLLQAKVANDLRMLDRLESGVLRMLQHSTSAPALSVG